MASIRGSFAQSISLSIAKTEQAVNDKIYAIARELFTSIVRLSPSRYGDPKARTATGLLINNWFPVNGAAYSSETTPSTSQTGSGSLTRINQLRGNNFFHTDGTVTLSNNLSYAYRAEVLGWPGPSWSGKVGPYRMVALSLQATAARYK